MRLIALTLMLIGLFCSSAPALADQTDLIEIFHKRYPPAASKIEEAYSQVRILARKTSRDEDGNITLITENEYLREGDLIRTVAKVLQSDDPQRPEGSVEALGGSAEEFFKVGKEDDASQFVIHSLKSTTSFDLIARDVARPIFAPYCVFDVRVVDYFDKSGVRILSAATTTFDGRQAIGILTEWSFEESGSGSGMIRYRFYFQPDTWTLMGFVQYLEPQRPQAPIVLHRLSYESGSNPPKLTELEMWGETPSDPEGQLKSRGGGTLYEIISVEFGEIPDEEFTLAAFGVEEPVVADSGSSIPWVIINVIIFGGLGIGFALLAVRRRRGATAA